MDDVRFCSKQVWLVGADPDTRVLVTRDLSEAGWTVLEFSSTAAALEAAKRERPAVACIDVGLPESSGLDASRRLETALPDLTCVLINAPRGVVPATGAAERGAYDAIAKPVDTHQLLQSVARAAERSCLAQRVNQLEVALETERAHASVIGESHPMQVVAEQVRRVADSGVSVCVVGESGTGKEFLARTLHQASDRRAGPFVVVNCSALREWLQAPELFGDERGTPAASGLRKGRLEEARGGTLFLDELGELSPATQAALLRLLQARTFRRVGGRHDIAFDARIVCATQRDLQKEVASGRFRADLYQLLAAYSIRLPALRERKSDIPLLVNCFIRQLSPDVGRHIASVSTGALDAMLTYDWPGNVRELRNIVHRAMLSADSSEISLAQLPGVFHGAAAPEAPRSGDVPRPSSEVLNLRELERRAIQRALETSGGCVSHAAKLLGIGRATIYRKLATFDMRGAQVAAGEAS